MYSTNNDKNVNNTTTNNKEHNPMYLISNTIDISKPPTIHAPNDIEKSIPCDHYMFGHLSHDKLESIISNIKKFLTKQCYTCAQTKMKKKPVKSVCHTRQQHHRSQVVYIDTYAWDIVSQPQKYKYITIIIDSRTRKKYKTNKKTKTNSMINFITDHNKVITNIRITNPQAPVPIQQVIVDQGTELYNNIMRPGTPQHRSRTTNGTQEYSRNDALLTN
eukprot:Pgem_evm1s16129